MSISSQTTAVLKLANRLATPLLGRQYLELVNPLWSAQCCGRIEQIVRETDHAVTLEIRPNYLWQGAKAGQYVRLASK